MFFLLLVYITVEMPSPARICNLSRILIPSLQSFFPNKVDPEGSYKTFPASPPPSLHPHVGYYKSIGDDVSVLFHFGYLGE